jgi:hypothetical protein
MGAQNLRSKTAGVNGGRLVISGDLRNQVFEDAADDEAMLAIAIKESMITTARKDGLVSQSTMRLIMSEQQPGEDNAMSETTEDFFAKF